MRRLTSQLSRLAVAAFLLAAIPARAAEAQPDTDKLGTKIEKVTLTDPAGKPVALSEIKDKKAVVVVFLSFECPVSNSYAAPLAEMAKRYADKGVAFLAVAPTEDPAAEVAKQVKEFNIPFPVYVDPKRTVADAFKATTTPEAFVLDHNFVLRYRGRIDNGYYARLKKSPVVTENDLQNALDDLLAGKAVRVPATRPVGCLIADKDKSKPVTTNVTYYKDVLPVLQKNCQQCHRPGEVGPFSLMTYKQAVRWADDIKDYAQTRRMPPWKPVEGVAFHNERRMSDADIRTLAAWVDGGMPAGDAKDAPPPVKFTDGWRLGEPDLVLTIDEDFHIGPGGRDLFRCFVLPTNLTEDKYVVAFEVRPGNPRAVHHTLNFFDATGQGRALEKKELERKKVADEPDHGPGYSVSMGIGFRPFGGKVGGIGGWAPGTVPTFLPDGAGYYLPKGSDIILQVHYHRTGKPEVDRTRIGLYFAKKPVARPWQGMIIPGRVLVVPPVENFKASGAVWVEHDSTIYSVMPHMHLLGKQVKITMTTPEGQAKTLVAIKEWDYNWQETYWLKEPIHVKRGTKLEIEAVYDNSAKNPNNPNNPPTWVRNGEQTTNEMLFGFIGATSAHRGRLFRLDPPKDLKKEEPKATLK